MPLSSGKHELARAQRSLPEQPLLGVGSQRGPSGSSSGSFPSAPSAVGMQHLVSALGRNWRDAIIVGLVADLVSQDGSAQGWTDPTSGTLASMRPPSEHAGTHSPTHGQERHLLSRMRTWRPTPSVRHTDDFGQRSHQERGRAQEEVTRDTHAMTSAVTSSRFVSLSVSCRAPS